MRTVKELTNVPDPAWPQLRRELAAAPVPIEILPIDPDDGRECLRRLQVTTRSRMGAVALNTGGLWVEDGWLRVLGGGAPVRQLPSLAEANGLTGTPTDPPPSMLVGYDVLGGRFEVNGMDPGALGRPGQPGDVCYFAPDSLKWEALGFGHGVWLSWIADGQTARFYEGLRWPSWREEARPLTGAQGLSVYPSLWSREAHADLAATSREAVPIAEIFALNKAVAEKFAGR
jgi:hypothetical protein